MNAITLLATGCEAAKAHPAVKFEVVAVEGGNSQPRF
jgi:hypothetical protein